MSQWFPSLLEKITRFGQGRSPAPPRKPARLGVEALEYREVMTATLGAAALHQAVPPPSAPAQVRTIAATPTTQNQAATQVGSLNAASPIQPQWIGFGSLNKVSGSDQAPNDLGILIDPDPLAGSAAPGKLNIEAYIQGDQFNTFDGQHSLLWARGTATNLGGGVSSIYLSGETESGLDIIFTGRYDANTLQMTGNIGAKDGEFISWSADYSGKAVGEGKRGPISFSGQTAQQLPGLAQNQLSPQQQSDALMVRPLSSTQMTQDIANAVQSFAQVSAQPTSNALQLHTASSQSDLGTTDLVKPL
jgi:hypothetical protein